MPYALVFDAPAVVAAFVAARTGGDFSSSPYAAIGLLRADGDENGATLVGGVVFNLYDPPDISVSVAVDPAGRIGVRRLIEGAHWNTFVF